jgi:HEAT repeat protein
MEKVFKENVDASMEQLLDLLGRVDSIPRRNAGNLIYFLGKTEDERARLPLEQLLDEEDSTFVKLRTGTIKALGEIGSTESILIISQFAADSSGRVRRETAVSLGKICDPGAIEILEELALDGSLDIRSAAEKALDMIEEKLSSMEEENEEITE